MHYHYRYFFLWGCLYHQKKSPHTQCSDFSISMTEGKTRSRKSRSRKASSKNNPGHNKNNLTKKSILIHDDHVRSSDVSGKSNNQDLNVLINIEDTDTKANCAPPPKGGVQHNPPPQIVGRQSGTTTREYRKYPTTRNRDSVQYKTQRPVYSR